MIRKITVTVALCFVCAISSLAQTEVTVVEEKVTEAAEIVGENADSVLVEGMIVPLVDKKHLRQMRFRESWYVGVQGGVYQSWGTHTSNLDFAKTLGPAVAVNVGKDISPYSSFRAQLLWGNNVGYMMPEEGAGGEKYKFNTAGLYVAYMPSLTNMLFGYREKRRVNLQAIIGVGAELSWGFPEELEPYFTWKHFLAGLQAGINISCRLSDRVYLNLEATENFLDDAYDRNVLQENHTFDGHLNMMLGLTFYTGAKKNSRHYRYVRDGVDEYAPLQEKINVLRGNIEYRRNNPNVEKDTVETNREIVYTLIAFEPQATSVNRLQQSNVFTTAKVWEHNPKAKIFICNSTGVDDELFRKRVASIKALLSERYDIPSNVMKAVADEGEIKRMRTSDKMSIVFIINE